MFATLIGAWPGEGPAPGEAVLGAIEDQATAGLDPISDGARPRDGARTDEVVAAWLAAAQLSAGPLVKATLVGPWTAATADAAGDPAAADPLARAEAIRPTIAALAAAGCRYIEIDEPAAVAIADAADEARFREAHLRLTDGSAAHLSLVLTGGNLDRLRPATFFDAGYASYTFDLVAGPDNWRLIAQAPGDRGIVCGALAPGADSDDRPELLVWAAHYAASTGGRGLVRVGLTNASSLARLSRERAIRKARALVEAARIADAASVADLAGQLDPRAIDSRTAAYGRVLPRPARRPTRRRPPGSAPS